jgi:superfamily II DNA or RNA helicase
VRKDGHHPIIAMQCGPIRYRADARSEAAKRPFAHLVRTRKTAFMLPAGMGTDAPIQQVYQMLFADEARNAMIFDDVLKALEAGRSPVILTERTDHLELLAARLKKFARNVVILKGGQGVKARRDVAGQLAAITDGQERVIVATARYIGEGFDDARLDTLFLTAPVAWRGTLAQYVGRLNRLHPSKRDVVVYDYVDQSVPVLARMAGKRRQGYEALGYRVTSDSDLFEQVGLS